MSPLLLALVAAGWCAGWLVGRTRPMPPHPPPAGVPVSIVVPARNEARRLPGLLAALGSCGHEIVVVDDSSTDGTAAIAHAAGAGGPTVAPPPGWNGKAWACWTGAQTAKGDVLVFLDADTELPAESVDALAGHALEADGLVSVMPRHRVVRPYEQLSALPALVAAMGAGSGPVGAARWWHGPAAFGMALAIPRPVYFAAGGHAAVRAEIAEDLALARAVDAVGAPVVAWCGTARGTVRMYAEGTAQLVRGWAKNLAAGARSLPPLRSAAIALWVAMLAQACTLLVTSAVGVGATSIGVAAAVYTAFATQTAVLARRVGPFTRAVALTLPVLVVAFCAIFVASFVLSVTGRRIIWRERPVRVGVRS